MMTPQAKSNFRGSDFKTLEVFHNLPYIILISHKELLSNSQKLKDELKCKGVFQGDESAPILQFYSDHNRALDKGAAPLYTPVYLRMCVCV